MGFFKKLFGLSDKDEHNEDLFDSLAYSEDDDEVEDYNDDEVEDYNDESDNNSFELPEVFYSLAKVRVMGIEDLDADNKEYVENDLEEGTHVYLRYDFDNPKDGHALQVMYLSHLIGYIDKQKAEIVHSYLRNGDIGAIVISKISSRDFNPTLTL